MPPVERAAVDRILASIYGAGFRARSEEESLRMRRAESVGWAANKRFGVSKFKFKFPRARTFELVRARSRLYRSQMLQVNIRWKALAEIYTMHSFSPFSNLNFFVKNRQNFFDIELMNIIEYSLIQSQKKKWPLF